MIETGYDRCVTGCDYSHKPSVSCLRLFKLTTVCVRRCMWHCCGQKDASYNNVQWADVHPLHNTPESCVASENSATPWHFVVSLNGPGFFFFFAFLGKAVLDMWVFGPAVMIRATVNHQVLHCTNWSASVSHRFLFCFLAHHIDTGVYRRLRLLTTSLLDDELGLQSYWCLFQWSKRPISVP